MYFSSNGNSPFIFNYIVIPLMGWVYKQAWSSTNSFKFNRFSVTITRFDKRNYFASVSTSIMDFKLVLLAGALFVILVASSPLPTTEDPVKHNREIFFSSDFVSRSSSQLIFDWFCRHWSWYWPWQRSWWQS